MLTDDVALDAEQAGALAYVRAGLEPNAEPGKNSAFLTGGAGTGKSSVVNALRALTGDDVRYCAPSNKAAGLIGGKTFHSEFGIPPKNFDVDDIFANKTKGWCETVAAVRLWVIDEVSMVNPMLFTVVYDLIQRAREACFVYTMPNFFFVGDFFQLPPVPEAGQTDVPYMFESHEWALIRPKIVYLKTNHRSDLDPELLRLLDMLRGKEPLDREWLQGVMDRLRAQRVKTPMYLCTHNATADRFNNDHFAELSTPVHEFEREILPVPGKRRRNGEQGRRDDDREAMQLAELGATSSVRLRVGTVVMLTTTVRECESDKGTIRVEKGQCGVVVGFSCQQQGGRDKLEMTGSRTAFLPDEKIRVHVKLYRGEEAYITTEVFTIRAGKRVVARAAQMPLCWAWAVSVHKSQGMTLPDGYEIAAQRFFADGQAYVALSRARSLLDVRLTGPEVDVEKMLPNERVLEFYKKASAA